MKSFFAGNGVPNHLFNSPEVAEDNSVEEVEEIEEEEEETEEEAQTRTRKTLSDDNKYCFTDKDKAKKSLENKELKYEDGSTVEGFRVWQITKNAEWDAAGVLTSGSVEMNVLARNQHQATYIYAEEKLDLLTTLAFKKSRGGVGRAKSKVTEDVLKFGHLMASFIIKGATPENGMNVSGGFKDNVSDSQKEEWKALFESTDKYAHYLNEDGSWKEAN